MSADDPETRADPLPSGILLQFLAWVAAQPRTYAEAMEAWRTSCPRLSIWEDAACDELVRVDPVCAAAHAEAAVLLTDRGAALLASRLPMAASTARPSPL